MKIDSLLKNFFEKYDSSAIRSIENLSKDGHMRLTESKIKGFTLNEGFNLFSEFIRGYAKYKVENVNKEISDERSKHEYILEQTKNIVKDRLFKECDVLYYNTSSFVESYIKGVRSMVSLVDETAGSMIEAGVDSQSIAAIHEFMDLFVDQLNESFDPFMNKLLWASGYNGKQRLHNQNQNLKPIFL